MARRFISELIYAISYEKDEGVRLKSREIESSFRNLFKVQSQQTNTPDSADPAQPRIVFSEERKLLMVTQIGVQINVVFTQDDKEKDVITQISKYCHDVYNATVGFRGAVPITESGIVVSVGYPSLRSQEEVITDLFGHFSKVSLPGKAVSFSMKLGYDSGDGYFVNLEPAYYQLREQEIHPSQAGKGQKIKVSDMKLVSSGYEIKIDINNKPTVARGSDYDKSPEPILGKFKEFLEHDLDNIMSFVK